ncbi:MULTISPECIES: TetR-like C-terminal domain-containing protein [Microbacterium]|uniref:TetR-like C-terminal domain-containing protein n=1 Tax=Microbacterium TaxID=33882 RepID=UPI002787C09A|nr:MULTISPECIES: TetR-like C-terminal domain-containing protein [Microbacterium]MDQ1074235.1 AcrR family transcriptional regulator [Microbacterium sp. SORGH_AS_0969]MDQ1114462.1 AcrR family transcriptional regulator [Microbacterium testaceum]
MPTPERTSLAEVVAQAARLLESGGPTAVTMQAVAAAVGVKAPSLYKRVRDREALLGLVGVATADDLTRRLTDAGGDLAELLTVFRRFGQERPEAFRLLFASSIDPERLAATSEPVLRATAAVVGPDRALDAARLLTSWALGFITMELTGAFRLGGDLDEAFAYGMRHIVGSLTSGQDAVRPAQGS